ncbi:receptor-like cytoplasmic kinase 176 [Helianthus annuus]|uniref:receptor-like cytoplasmic kinase 176 n=1 Tax=Helianthus annuus TaxID=4232 RepID=UPI0016532BD6|nr:receptor-like cytoplasmic kinase 176 [Helianthus annuus]
MNQSSTYVNTLVKGTFGYLDPNYYATGKLTKKSDVYAFGVVLLEVLCRKRAVDRSLDEEQWGLVTWFQDSIKEGNLKHIIDLDIRGEISPKCLKEFIRIIQRCLHHDLKQRPTMAEVLFSLESVLALQEKFENWLQLARRTIIGRIVDMLPFTSKGENSGVSKLSSGSRGNNMLPSPSLKVFKFSDLEKATSNFSLDFLLGEGLYGKVFLGWVEQDTLAPSTQGVGTAVAIKRVNQESLQGLAEWRAEVELLSKLRHCNLVSLIGYCNYEKEMILVYEYVPNGTLDDHLHKFNTPLSWLQRLNICIGACRGLHYLHTGTGVQSGVIHRDVKSSNILLHESWTCKISDFGLSKACPTDQPSTHVSTRIKGTFGYLDPNYYATGRLTRKSDVYAFGVVLLEVLCRKHAVDGSLDEEQWSLATWAQDSIKEGKLKDIIDSDIKEMFE